MIHFRGFSVIPKIILKNQLWVSDNSEVDYRYCTKILKDVSNPGNFTGEPPQMAAQPPPAVAKFISEPLFYFPLYLFLFIIFCVFNYLFSIYFIILICWLLFLLYLLTFVDLLNFCLQFCRHCLFQKLFLKLIIPAFTPSATFHSSCPLPEAEASSFSTCLCHREKLFNFASIHLFQSSFTDLITPAAAYLSSSIVLRPRRY